MKTENLVFFRYVSHKIVVNHLLYIKISKKISCIILENIYLKEQIFMKCRTAAQHMPKNK